MLRSCLDAIYGSARVASYLSMVSILLLVVAQMVWRLIGVPLFGTDEFSGYMLIATFFLALGPTLKAGEHIRVTLLLQAIPRVLARFFNLLSLVIGLGLSTYFAYWAVILVVESYAFNEVGQGMVKTPLWIPQLSMAIGLIILVIAFLDELVIAFATSGNLAANQAESHLLETGEV